MEWQHKAANNFNGFPMRLQTLGVARAGHSTSTLNWLHSILFPHSPSTVSTLQLCCSCGVWMFIAVGAREKRWSGSNANAMWMLWHCVNANECEWVRVWVSVIVNVHVNGNGFWTTGNALFHAQFHSGIYYAKCGAVWRAEVPETAFH